MIVAIGMDPGPKPGLVALMYQDSVLLEAKVVQCTANAWLDVLDLWLLPAAMSTEESYYFGAERFVIGQGSYRSGSPGALTRDQVGQATNAVKGRAYRSLNTAHRVKAWASDARLKAAGLLEPTKGMQHARDGARHALFVAVHDARMPDPLSRKAKRDA